MVNQLSIRARISTTPRPDPVESDARVPARAAAVVIGGGIIGTSTALALADKGINVVLCEKGENRRRAVEPQLGVVPDARA